MHHRLRTASLVALLCIVASPTSIQAAPRDPVAAIIAESQAGSVAKVLRKSLADAGYSVRALGFAAALKPNALVGVDLLALTDAGALPAPLHQPIKVFLHRGGNLVAFGLPAWKTPLLNVGGKWVGAAQYARSNAWRPPTNPLLDLATANVSTWKRASDRPDSVTTSVVEPAGSDAAVHVSIANLTSWDTFGPAPFDQPFAPGETITVFCAKGDVRTPSLAVEWDEKDGSRWIATVPLTTEWRRYEVPPSAFRYWPSNPGRGGSGDALHPENASALVVGLAFSHTGTVGGKHEYWIGNLGTASIADSPLAAMDSQEEIDGVYPGYKSFPVHEATRLQAFGSRIAVPPGIALRAVHPRPSGAGFDKGRTVRYEPLVVARTNTGAWRGDVGAMYIHNGGRYKRGVWAVFGINDSRILTSATFAHGISAIARRMAGPLLVEAGSEWYTYFPGQEIRLGARLAGELPPDLSIQTTVRESRNGRRVWTRSWTGARVVVSASVTPPRGVTGPWLVTTTLARGPRILDAISQTIYLYNPPPTRSYVTANAGKFRLNGKLWKINGVNYMPSSGVGRDHPQDDADFENWLGSSAYDPDIVARDLDNIKRIGLNAVSIFCYADSVKSGNLLDFLRQCRERGLKVDLSLRPGTPMDFQWDAIRPIINNYRLKEDDTVIAYDLAWEPFFGGDQEREKYNESWTAWVVKKYGSIENAVKAWGYQPRMSGAWISGPSGQQLSLDGEWMKCVIDYRLFVEQLVGERYAKARDLVRSVDPNHMVSFRMTETSDPTYNWDSNMPYDFRGLAHSVDIFAPEGYGRMGAWSNTRHGWFEVEYAHAVNPDLPVIWKEAGQSAWQAGLDQAQAARLKEQGEAISTFYRMLKSSGSNGVYWWWYPGGFRTNEQSDFGIINPDGSDRPATKAIRVDGPSFLKSPAPITTDEVVDIRLDQHATGLYGAYKDVQDKWWFLIGEGRKPGVKLAE